MPNKHRDGNSPIFSVLIQLRVSHDFTSQTKPLYHDQRLLDIFDESQLLHDNLQRFYDMKLFFMSFNYSAKALQVCGVLKERVNVTKIKIANFALAVNTGS